MLTEIVKKIYSSFNETERGKNLLKQIANSKNTNTTKFICSFYEQFCGSL